MDMDKPHSPDVMLLSFLIEERFPTNPSPYLEAKHKTIFVPADDYRILFPQYCTVRNLEDPTVWVVIDYSEDSRGTKVLEVEEFNNRKKRARFNARECQRVHPIQVEGK